MHSSLLVSCGDTRIMIDCGSDWLGQLGAISPDAIVITHAHSDHAFGLKNGSPCPVFATAETWRSLDRMPIRKCEIVTVNKAFSIGSISLEAFSVVHSPIAPAVGYRISSRTASLFYVPDVLSIPDRRQVLSGIDVYIGDGARMEHPILRGKGERVSGHASVCQQLSWCEDARVSRAIFTHCGTPIISANDTEINARLEAMGQRVAVQASLARDGQKVRLS